MTKILLVYPPFCTPASPPYSITYLYSFLTANCDPKVKIELLDLNLLFHKIKFPQFHRYYQDMAKWADYDKKTDEYSRLTKEVYSCNNRKVVKGEKPELFEEIKSAILERKPDIIAFSIVYSSQAFFAYALLKELRKLGGTTTIIGGPAVNEKLTSIADHSLKNEIELLEFISKMEGKTALDYSKLKCSFPVDFCQYSLKDYFTPKPVLPVKTSSTCYYRQCAFCSHYSDIPYMEYPVDFIKRTIMDSGQKYFFFIDDMIHPKRLLALAEAIRPLKVRWICQLRPTIDFDPERLKTLRECGLSMVLWGVESASDKVLKKIRKGTNKADIERVLKASHRAGIKNCVFIMFGFPGETKDDFIETIEFLKRNKEDIDLVSTSIFGLQKKSAIFKDPEEFGVTKIIEHERTVLEPSITYEVKEGLTQEEANRLRSNYRKTIDKLNKYPKSMNFFREHMLCLSDAGYDVQ